MSTDTVHPRVSVIVPVYNDESGLGECLRGLAAQTYPADRIRVIVVDNGSRPPLDPGLDRPAKPAVIRCANPGSYAARNAGAAIADGEVLAFTDADCVPDPEWLEQGVAALQADGGQRVVGGDVLFLPTGSRSGTSLYQQAAGFGQSSNIRDRGFSATANLLCSARQFREVGSFDEHLFSGGDREWCWRAARRGFQLRFAAEAVVRTAPRTRLRDAVRQARRVAAGRRQLAGRAEVEEAGLRRERTLAGAVGWILTRREMSYWERLRVLVAAVCIRLAAIAEAVRLSFGRLAERR